MEDTILAYLSKYSDSVADFIWAKLYASFTDHQKKVHNNELPLGAQWTERNQGRTYYMACRLIDRALRSPNKWFTVVDHYGTREADKALLHQIMSICDEYDLVLYNPRAREQGGSIYFRFQTEFSLDDMK